MIRGKSIRIYLADGTVTGIRHAEIVNWTGQAIACPRKMVGELSNWQEASSPGVYFLLGKGDHAERPVAYVGEAENVLSRLQQHIGNKDFWNEVIFFTNKDENLTKSHVKFLESKLISLSNEASRYLLENGNVPKETVLPRADRDAMYEFMANIRLLMGALGHKILEPLAPIHIPVDVVGAPDDGQPNQNIQLVLKRSKKTLARALQTNEGIVVLKDSLALKVFKEALSTGYKTLKEDLIKNGTLAEDGDCLTFTHDYLFSAPSSAAAVILGQNTNGRTAWKTEAGKTLKEIEEKVS